MAKKTRTRLTFSLSIDMPSGMNIPKMREYIKSALHTEMKVNKECPVFDLDNVKVHLLNKETSYG